MGKVKTKRFKYHRAANKSTETNRQEPTGQDVPMDAAEVPALPANFGGLFQDIAIDPSKLSLKLDLNDNISVVSSGKPDARHISKKEKRKMRHEAFIKKLETAKAKRRTEKQRKKVPASLSMGLLADALPTLKEISKKSSKSKEKPRANMSYRANRKLMLQDMKHMQLVAKHPQFQADPMAAVLNHLRQTVQSEQPK